jgi:hypothetical protein
MLLKPRNPYAREVRESKYRMRVVPLKKLYNRKKAKADFRRQMYEPVNY